MSKRRRLMVVMVLETGDKISTSVTKNGVLFSKADIDTLKKNVQSKLLSKKEDALYFRIRYNEKEGKLKGISINIKTSKPNSIISEIDNFIKSVESKVGTIYEEDKD